MSTLVEQVTVGSEVMTVPKIVWRRFRRPMPGLVERIYAHPSNRGLAAAGAYLPLGTVVTIPIDTPRSSQVRTAVRLW